MDFGSIFGADGGAHRFGGGAHRSGAPGAPPGLPSDDPLLSGPALGQYLREQAQAVTDASRTNAMFTGMFMTQMKGSLDAIAERLQSLDAIREELAPTSSMPSIGTRTAMPTRDSDEAPLTFAEGRRMGATATMGDVTTGVARAASKAISQHGTLWEQQGDQYVQTDSAGNVLQTLNVGDPGAQQAYEQGSSRMRRMNVAAAAFGRYGAGEGVMGALGGTAARMAGPIGIGMAVADRVYTGIGEQTAAGAEWRQTYGEEAGRFGIKQRVGRSMAGWDSYFAGVGRERGQQAYSAMAGLGLKGDMLDRSVDFDQDMYLQHGMSTETSSQFVDVARKTNTSLSSLAEQIEKVGSSAVAAGQNSEAAIQRFASGISLLQSQVSNTSGSVTTAGVVTSTLSANLPTGLNTDANQQAVLGTLNQSNIAMVAARTGQDPMTLMNQVALGNAAAQGSVISGSIDYAVEVICQNAGITKEALAAEVNKVTGGGQPTTTQMEQILAKYPSINPMSVAGVFQTFGIAFAPGDQMQMFFQGVIGAFSDIGNGGPTGMGDFAKSLAGISPGAGQTSLIEGGYDKAVDAGTAGDPLAKAMGLPSGSSLATGIYDGYSAYKGWASKTGDRSKSIEALITNGSAVESFAGVGLDEATIQTSAGKKTFAEVMADPKLAAEVDAGTAAIVGANDKDVKSIAEITGYGNATASAGGAAAGGYMLTLTPEAQRIFRLSGPSESQETGTPAAAYVSPRQY